MKKDGLITIAVGLGLCIITLVIIIAFQEEKISKIQSDNKAWNYCLDDRAFNDSLRGFNECVKVYHAVNK